ncbi:MAG: hypothetical protein FWH36_09390, partial [Lentimicrobiaceae bacterium]|nr:hypothetical protein [Lentimicrobiaceae bacterium]
KSIFFTINSKLYAKILFITLSSHFQPPFCPLSLIFNKNMLTIEPDRKFFFHLWSRKEGKKMPNFRITPF